MAACPVDAGLGGRHAGPPGARRRHRFPRRLFGRLAGGRGFGDYQDGVHVTSVKGVPKGPHVVALASTSSVPFRGLTFTGATWLLPSADGYVDNQAGVQ
jgi:hypothetical protein